MHASNTLVAISKQASRVADKTSYERTTYSILASAMSELGELAQEVAITNGHSYKELGPDGVVGEAIDVIVSLLDLIHVLDPTITEEDLSNIAHTKCNKWINKILEKTE